MSKYSNCLFKFDLLILSLLKDKDMYGYEITKKIQNITDETIAPKHGTMYPIIYNLIENGYITSNTVIVKNKARVYYHLEPDGEIYLHKITQEYDNLVKCIDLIVHGGSYER